MTWRCGHSSSKVSRAELLFTALQIPRGQVAEVPGVGHCMMIEQPDATFEVLERFFGSFMQVGSPSMPGARHTVEC